ncbi:hypothetical protein T439DRAFT_33012 [Meredithblackwellia eburnea MCA 4105]
MSAPFYPPRGGHPVPSGNQAQEPLPPVAANRSAVVPRSHPITQPGFPVQQYHSGTQLNVPPTTHTTASYLPSPPPGFQFPPQSTQAFHTIGAPTPTAPRAYSSTRKYHPIGGVDHRRKKSLRSLPKDNVCTVCHKGFRGPTDLKRHMDTHHSNEKPVEEYPYLCQLCNERFKTEYFTFIHLVRSPRDSPGFASVITLQTKLVRKKVNLISLTRSQNLAPSAGIPSRAVLSYI